MVSSRFNTLFDVVAIRWLNAITFTLYHHFLRFWYETAENWKKNEAEERQRGRGRKARIRYEYTRIQYRKTCLCVKVWRNLEHDLARQVFFSILHMGSVTAFHSISIEMLLWIVVCACVCVFMLLILMLVPVPAPILRVFYTWVITISASLISCECAHSCVCVCLNRIHSTQWMLFWISAIKAHTYNTTSNR